MAAQYTEVTLDDMEKFLKRGFRALRPKQGVNRGEYYYDLTLSPHMLIRVWTSIQRGSDSGAGVGEDAIRVQLLSMLTKRPLVAGKAPIVKRTQGWKNTLQNKIEDAIEIAEEKEAAGDAQDAARQPPPPVEAPVREEVRQEFVDDNDGEAYADDPPPSAPAPKQTFYGTWTQYRGEWCARIQEHGIPGAKAILETKGGRRAPVNLHQKLWGGRPSYGGGDYAEIWSVLKPSRTAEDSGADDYNYDRR
jgi:hypothetical protein